MPKTSNQGGKLGGSRKPHNARRAADVESLDELVARVGDELRRIPSSKGAVEMTRLERTLRLQVERALEGKVRDVAHLLRLMSKYPSVAKSYREETVIIINGPLANV